VIVVPVSIFSLQALCLKRVSSMPMPDRERWRQLSAELDWLLGMGEQPRALRLAAIAFRDPALAAELKELLDASTQAAAAGFLEGSVPVHP
jgi:hypothetical protein